MFAVVFIALTLSLATHPVGGETDACLVCVCFQQPSIYSVNCSGQGLTALPRLPHNATSVDLSDNALTTNAIPLDAFAGMLHLVELDMSNNPLSLYPRALAVGALPSLVRLSLDNTGLQGLYANSLLRMPRLTLLSVQHNLLTYATLQAGVFANATSLEQLTLDGNTFIRIPNGLLDTPGLTNLAVLSLNGVGLRSVSDDDFASMPSLNVLSLAFNALSNATIAPRAFHSLPALQSLNFTGNPLGNLPTAIVAAPLPNLQTLALADTLISSLPATSFSGMPSMSKLDLSDNQLNTNSLDAAVFQPTPVLSDISLANNPLDAWPAALLSLGGLGIVDLSYANLKVLPANALGASAGVIDWLLLDGNLLTSQSIDVNVFAGATSLSKLQLNDNPLLDEFPGALLKYPLPTLETLEMRACSLRSLPEHAFRQMPRLASLILEQNQLSNLPALVFNSTTNLEVLGLSRNPLGAKWPVALTPNSRGLKSIVTLTLSAVGLTELPWGALASLPAAGGTLLDLSYNRLTASSIAHGVFNMTPGIHHLKLDHNPLGSVPSALTLLTNLVAILDLTATGLTALPSGALACVQVLGNTVLLADNELTAQSIAPNSFDALHFVSTIDLSNNPLGAYPAALQRASHSQYFLNNLNELRLDNTAITTLPADAFASMVHLVTLSLANCGLSLLPDDLFNATNTLATLILDGNPLGTVPLAVSRVSSLVELSIANVGMTAVPENAFYSMPTLLSLNLTDNHLIYLPDAVFSVGAYSLQELILDGNLLVDGLPQPVAQLSALRTLSARRAYVTRLPPIVVITGTISQLYLDDNYLDTVPQAIQSMSRLSTLSLSNNRLTSVPSDTFASLTLLRTLHLQNNPITELPATLFSAVHTLQTLLLDSCLLTDYPVAALGSLRSLVSLSITSNGIVSLPAGSFDATVSLHHLNASNNSIVSIPCGLFDTVRLNSLYLMDNQLASVDSCWLDALSHLRTFSLAGNDLTRADDVFANWDSLYTLSLQSNVLLSVPTGLPVSLQMLFLNDNHIRTLDPATLVPLANLTFIDLESNDLTTDTLLYLFSFYSETRLRLLTFNVGHNDLKGSFIVPPLGGLDLCDNELSAIVTDTLPFTRAWGLLNILNNTGFLGPACPPNIAGTYPLCDGVCSTLCTPGGIGGCSSPSPRDCCPPGFHGPRCAYAYQCMPSICSQGACVAHAPIEFGAGGLSYTYNLTCECAGGLLNLQPQTAAQLAISNVPSCVHTCPVDTFTSPAGSCEPCDSTCTRGCTASGVAGCIRAANNTPVVAGVSATVAVLIAILAVWLVAGRRRRRAVAQTRGIYERLLNDVNQIWQVAERDVHFERKLAAGASGEVWIGEWLGRVVAVKKLRMEVAETDDEMIRDFNREVEFLKGIRHRNIVLFFGAGRLEQARCPFLVLEYMERGSLDKLLHGPDELAWDVRVGIASDVARGMQFLHQRDPPVLHRDLKSLNVLLNNRWIAKIADFGESRAISALRGFETGVPGKGQHGGKVSASSREVTSRRGTPGWCAPEALTVGGQVGLAADVFSFAIVMWEICAREFPFSALPVWQVNEAVELGERPLIPHEAPADLANLIERCWKQVASDRPSFQEASDALDCVQI